MKLERLRISGEPFVHGIVPAEFINNNITKPEVLSQTSVVCYFKAADSTTLLNLTDIIRKRKECGLDPTPKDLPYQEFRFDPFSYQPEDKSYSVWCEFVSDSSYTEAKDKGFWMTGTNSEGSFKANIRRYQEDGESADRRLVITGPGAVQTGSDFFGDIIGKDDLYWNPVESFFIRTNTREMFFLDYYNPERYITGLSEFFLRYMPEDTRAVCLSWDEYPTDPKRKEHGFDMVFIFPLDTKGRPLDKKRLISFSVTSIGKLEPEIHFHCGWWNNEGVYEDNLNLPQTKEELVQLHYMVLSGVSACLCHEPVKAMILELIDLLIDEDHSVLLHEKDSYKVRDCFPVIFRYFDQDTIPPEWADLLKGKLKVDKPIVSADPHYFRAWTGIDKIPYEVPLIVVPYRLFVFLMNDREQTFFEDTDVEILSDYSDQYPELMKVDLHNTGFLPVEKVLVKVNKNDLNKCRLYRIDQIDTSANCSRLFLATPHLTTLGDVEKGVTYIKETLADDARSVYAGGIRK
jgi:hypothetical protein